MFIGICSYIPYDTRIPVRSQISRGFAAQRIGIRGREGKPLPRWWWKVRYGVKTVMLPLICVQFVRTLILPNPLDVFILFLFFMAYLGFLLNFY